jgi:predicted membrane protein
VTARPVAPDEERNGMQPASLAVALVLMVTSTVDPRLLVDAAGRADHALATVVFWAMSAGFVRGVGFLPRTTPIRWLLSGWACVAALLLAALIKLAR